MENRIMASLDTLLTLSSGIKASELAGLGVTGTSLGITPASLGVVNAEERMNREVTLIAAYDLQMAHVVHI